MQFRGLKTCFVMENPARPVCGTFLAAKNMPPTTMPTKAAVATATTATAPTTPTTIMNTTTSATARDLPENEQEDKFVGIQSYVLGVMLQSLGCRSVFDGRKSQAWNNASSTAIPSVTPITTPTATATIVLLAAAIFATAATSSKSILNA